MSGFGLRSHASIIQDLQRLKIKNKLTPTAAVELHKELLEADKNFSGRELEGIQERRARGLANQPQEIQDAIREYESSLVQPYTDKDWERVDNLLESMGKDYGAGRFASDRLFTGDQSEEDVLNELAEIVKQSKIVEANTGYKLEELGDSSKLAEVKRNGKILREGKLPTTKAVTPYDSIEGYDLNKSESRDAIDGWYQPDSEVRGFTEYGTEVDPLLSDIALQDNETNREINRVGVVGEYLSPEGGRRLYNKWKRSVETENRNNTRYQAKTSPRKFNEMLTEYYGQQAAKLSGRTPVSDLDRSGIVLDNPNHVSSTLGTSRLLELSNKLTNPEIRNAADYRYMKDGQIVVADHQSRALLRGQTLFGEHTLPLNIFKASSIEGRDRIDFANNLNRELTEGSGSLDEALRNLNMKRQLPAVVQATPSGNSKGVRAGKVMADADFMGTQNKDQYRMNEVIFSVPSDSKMNKPGIGAVPKEVLVLDNAKARDYIAQNPEYTNNIVWKGLNAMDMQLSTSALINNNVVKRLIDNGKLSSQVSKPFSL